MLGKNLWTLRDLLLFFGVLYLSFATETCDAQNKPADVKALLKERRDLLSEAASQMAKLYMLPKTKITVQEMIQAERASLQADMDWFEKPADRIKAIETHKNVANRLLESAKVNFSAARQPKYVVSQAKAYVLEVQLQLLKEKEKQKATPGK